MDTGVAATDDAMVHYRSVIYELLPNASIKREDAKDGSSRRAVETPQRRASYRRVPWLESRDYKLMKPRPLGRGSSLTQPP